MWLSDSQIGDVRNLISSIAIYNSSKQTSIERESPRSMALICLPFRYSPYCYFFFLLSYWFSACVSHSLTRDYCRSDALEALRRELVDNPQLTTVPRLSSSLHLNGLSSESSSSSPAVASIHAELSIATPYSTSSSSCSHSALLVEWYQWEIEQMQTTFAKVTHPLSHRKEMLSPQSDKAETSVFNAFW